MCSELLSIPGEGVHACGITRLRRGRRTLSCRACPVLAPLGDDTSESDSHQLCDQAGGDKPKPRPPPPKPPPPPISNTTITVRGRG